MDKDKEKSRVRIKNVSAKELAILDPEQRLRSLAEEAEVEIDFNRQPQKYFRSGVELVRMANFYVNEGNYEQAYQLYLRFMTLFLEKIQKHPSYSSVPVKDKEMNKKMLRDVLPKTEKLKKQLLEQYRKELIEYNEQVKQQEKAETEKMKREEKQRLKEEEDKIRVAALIASKSPRTSSISLATVVPIDETKTKSQSTITPQMSSEIPQSSKDRVTPSIDRSTKPLLLAGDRFTLRDVILPSRLMHDFLKLASTNTENNKETCGILAGKLERGKLVVTHLLIPQQTGSPDSCITHNEETIFDYQDQHNLITLGWIHTHPTQTAFLSSVDLHTHCSYQLMMAEAIAIVCAPKYHETSFFMLTPEYGLHFIANCRESGFHPHPTESPLYVNAKHCKVDQNASVEVIDLRKK